VGHLAGHLTEMDNLGVVLLVLCAFSFLLFLLRVSILLRAVCLSRTAQCRLPGASDCLSLVLDVVAPEAGTR